MKHIFIINPKAGKIDTIELICMIYAVCEKYKLEYDIRIASNVGDVQAIAKIMSKENEKCIIHSVGGDGTLNEVVNGIIDTNATLGVIPTGSGNDFFRMLSEDNRNVIERTIQGYNDLVNIGKVNQNYFINIASIGYDADVAFNVDVMKNCSYISKDKVYYASILYTLLTFESPRLRIMFNNMTLEQQITLLAICNGKYYGNGIPIAPGAKYDDDFFDICLVDKINKLRIPFILNDLLKGKHEKHSFVHTYTTDYIKVEAENLLRCNVDGEIIISDSFEFGIIKNKIKILKPKKTT